MTQQLEDALTKIFEKIEQESNRRFYSSVALTMLVFAVLLLIRWYDNSLLWARLELLSRVQIPANAATVNMNNHPPRTLEDNARDILKKDKLVE